MALYSGHGGGPAPETRREEGRPPPPPPSWTGPGQLPRSHRPDAAACLEPRPPSSDQPRALCPHAPLPLRAASAIAPGPGARGRGGGRSPPPPVAIRSSAAVPAPVVSASGSAGPDPFPPRPGLRAGGGGPSRVRNAWPGALPEGCAAPAPPAARMEAPWLRCPRSRCRRSGERGGGPALRDPKVCAPAAPREQGPGVPPACARSSPGASVQAGVAGTRGLSWGKLPARSSRGHPFASQLAPSGFCYLKGRSGGGVAVDSRQMRLRATGSWTPRRVLA